MPVTIDKIEEKDQNVRQIFPNAQIMKISQDFIVWTNEGVRVASLELDKDRKLVFEFAGK